MISYILKEWPLGLIVLLGTFVLILVVIALNRLRDSVEEELPRILWTALILLIPIMGSIAFLIVHSAEENEEPE